MQNNCVFVTLPRNKYIITEIMTKNVFIFRHGQTDKNLAQQLQGSGCDDSLNATGMQQAEELAQKVKDLSLEKLYSSSLRRARQTAAKILAANNNLSLEIVADLREGYFGSCEGRDLQELKIEQGDFITEFFFPNRSNWHKHFEGGESKQDIFNRAIKCLYKIVEAPENTVGIVCHAGVISALQCGLDLQNVSYDNCTILHLQFDTETQTFVKVD